MKALTFVTLAGIFLTGCAETQNTQPINTQSTRTPTIHYDQAVDQIRMQQAAARWSAPEVDETKWGALKVGMPAAEAVALLGGFSSCKYQAAADSDFKQVETIAYYGYKGDITRTVTFDGAVKGDGRVENNGEGKVKDWSGRKP